MEMGCEELNLSVKAFKKHAECNHFITMLQQICIRHNWAVNGLNIHNSLLVYGKSWMSSISTWCFLLERDFLLFQNFLQKLEVNKLRKVSKSNWSGQLSTVLRAQKLGHTIEESIGIYFPSVTPFGQLFLRGVMLLHQQLRLERPRGVDCPHLRVHHAGRDRHDLLLQLPHHCCSQQASHAVTNKHGSQRHGHLRRPHCGFSCPMVSTLRMV